MNNELIERIELLLSFYSRGAIANTLQDCKAVLMCADADNESLAEQNRKLSDLLTQQQEAEVVGEIPEGFAVCPISGRKFWGNIEHPELGNVATYGGPFDTYTVPSAEWCGDEAQLRCERFDQDEGAWVEGGEPFGWFYEDQQPKHPPKPAAQPQVPEGYQLVPIKPTSAMLQAGNSEQALRQKYSDPFLTKLWDAMLSAAKKSAQPQVPEGYQMVREPKPNQNGQSFADRLAYWRTERPSEWLMDEFIRDAQILEAKLAAKEEGK